MTGLRIVRTSREELRPLAASGAVVRDNYPQLRAHIAEIFGDAAAALFAEPSYDGGSGAVDWYAPGHGVAQRFIDLDEGGRWKIASGILKPLNDMRADSERLSASADRAEQALGDEIACFLKMPSLDYVYVVDGAPVLTAWGHEAKGVGAFAGDLFATVRPPPPPPPPSSAAKVAAASEKGRIAAPAPSPGAAGFGRTLLWLLLAILAAAVIYYARDQWGGAASGPAKLSAADGIRPKPPKPEEAKVAGPSPGSGVKDAAIEPPPVAKAPLPAPKEALNDIANAPSPALDDDATTKSGGAQPKPEAAKAKTDTDAQKAIATSPKSDVPTVPDAGVAANDAGARAGGEATGNVAEALTLPIPKAAENKSPPDDAKKPANTTKDAAAPVGGEAPIKSADVLSAQIPKDASAKASPVDGKKATDPAVKVELPNPAGDSVKPDVPIATKDAVAPAVGEATKKPANTTKDAAAPVGGEAPIKSADVLSAQIPKDASAKASPVDGKKATDPAVKVELPNPAGDSVKPDVPIATKDAVAPAVGEATKKPTDAIPAQFPKDLSAKLNPEDAKKAPDAGTKVEPPKGDVSKGAETAPIIRKEELAKAPPARPQLEGIWLQEGDLNFAAVAGDAPRVKSWLLTFDAAGRGEQIVVFENDEACRGPIRAEIVGDKVNVTDVAVCEGKRGPAKTDYVCAIVEESALSCSWSQPDRGASGAGVTLRRLRT